MKLSKYVDFASKKMKLDVDYFAKASFWLYANQGFAVLKSFILSLFLANLLSTEVYGQYLFVLSVISMVTITALPGMKTALVQSATKFADGTYFKAVKTIMKYSMIGSVILLAVALYGGIVGRDTGIAVFLTSAFLFPFFVASQQYVHFFTGRKNFKKLAILKTIFNTTQLAIMILIVLFSGKIYWLIITYILTFILIEGYFSFFYVKKFMTKKSMKKVDEPLLKYGFKYTWIFVLSNPLHQLGIIILPALSSFTAAAVYGIATKLFEIVNNLLRTFNETLLPKLVDKQHLKLKQLRKYYWYMMLVSIAAYAVMYFAIPYVVNWFFPLYMESIVYARVLSVLFITLPNGLIHSYLNMRKKLRLFTWLIVVGRGMYLVLLAVLAPTMLIMGVVLAQVIPKLFTTAVYIVYMYIPDK